MLFVTWQTLRITWKLPVDLKLWTDVRPFSAVSTLILAIKYLLGWWILIDKEVGKILRRSTKFHLLLVTLMLDFFFFAENSDFLRKSKRSNVRQEFIKIWQIGSPIRHFEWRTVIRQHLGTKRLNTCPPPRRIRLSSPATSAVVMRFTTYGEPWDEAFCIATKRSPWEEANAVQEVRLSSFHQRDVHIWLQWMSKQEFDFLFEAWWLFRTVLLWILSEEMQQLREVGFHHCKIQKIFLNLDNLKWRAH